ncbi:0e75fe52-b737-4f46-892e-e2affb330725 [Thermothielavioides terrestris]|uniref:0e75fe52-b737-4f46-892e-e2affb330725 n=1 Tax=Thermothielavioides terrestris TaxID=2587410 RepID=A0A446BS24_9PEZI|nr:0e75fe52-b737-4f46-892e-e2affb330725 [Thermothielavioides terrestris]
MFAGIARRAQRKKSKGAQDTFLVTSIREMTTILGAAVSQPDTDPDPKVALPKELRNFADLFDKEKANGLPPYRGEADHHIRLKTGLDGKPPELPAAFHRIRIAEGDKHLTAFRDYVTVYLDDVLVYSSRSRKDHIRKVRKVLRRLRDTGLNLDLKKCTFAVKEVKYLGYIVEARVYVRPDPEKIKAIREWEAPRKVQGGKEEQDAFDTLKAAFISEPILA